MYERSKKTVCKEYEIVQLFHFFCNLLFNKFTLSRYKLNRNQQLNFIYTAPSIFFRNEKKKWISWCLRDLASSMRRRYLYVIPMCIYYLILSYYWNRHKYPFDSRVTFCFYYFLLLLLLARVTMSQRRREREEQTGVLNHLCCGRWKQGEKNVSYPRDYVLKIDPHHMFVVFVLCFFILFRWFNMVSLARSFSLCAWYLSAQRRENNTQTHTHT